MNKNLNIKMSRMGRKHTQKGNLHNMHFRPPLGEFHNKCLRKRVFMRETKRVPLSAHQGARGRAERPFFGGKVLSDRRYIMVI